jgi:protein-tyrosine phosphatase
VIDIHCHILSGLDDGPSTLEESLKMAEEAVFEGIDMIVATPHDQVKGTLNNRQRIFAAIDELNEAIRTEGIPLQVNVNKNYNYLEIPENPLASYMKQLIRTKIHMYSENVIS